MLGELAKTTIISALLTIDVCILVCRRHQVHPPPQGKVKIANQSASSTLSTVLVYTNN